MSTGLTALLSSHTSFTPEAGAAAHGGPGFPHLLLRAAQPGPGGTGARTAVRGLRDLRNVVPPSVMRHPHARHWRSEVRWRGPRRGGWTVSHGGHGPGALSEHRPLFFLLPSADKGQPAGGVHPGAPVLLQQPCSALTSCASWTLRQLWPTQLGDKPRAGQGQPHSSLPGAIPGPGRVL